MPSSGPPGLTIAAAPEAPSPGPPGLTITAALGLAGSLVVLVSAGPLIAQEGDRLGQMSLEELLDLRVTSAAKIEQKTSEAPGVVTVITRDQVRTFGWSSLGGILERQPGFGPSQDFDRRTVGSRGLFEGWNNNHLLLLVDGVPVNDDLYGSAFTSEVTPLAFLRSVEIVRGPGSALYGSSATNGVVQVNTISPKNLGGTVEAELTVGEGGERRFDVAAGHEGSLVSAVVAFSSFATDGNEVLSRDGSGRLDEGGDPLAFRTRDRRGSSYLWVKLEGRGPLAGLSLQYHEQDFRFQTGHGWLWWIPDLAEDMSQTRRIVSLQYRPKPLGRLTPEVLARYQHHRVDWSQRYYPDGAFSGFYPAGMWEYLRTSADDLFLRGQVTVALPDGATAIGAVEVDRFSYAGDDVHESNVDVDGGAAPFPGDAVRPLGPWLDYIADEPLVNVGILGQLTTGRLLGNGLHVTAGARYDRLSFDYARIQEPGRPRASRSFSQLSPRLAVVVQPAAGISVKVMGARAFRAPAPTELAGAHTFSLASNIERLSPEVITTYEAAAEWAATKGLTLRANAFRTRFENQIAYSAQANNLVANIYSLTTAGLEAEVLFDLGDVSGFLNYSYARRLDETILDETIAASPDRLTWMPSHMLNAGVRAALGAFTASLSGHLNGRVERRASDVGVQALPFGVGVTLDMDRYRGRYVPGWVTVDLRLAYHVSKRLEVSVQAKNLLDRDYSLVKVGPFPFDYRQEGRRLLASGRASF